MAVIFFVLMSLSSCKIEPTQPIAESQRSNGSDVDTSLAALEARSLAFLEDKCSPCHGPKSSGFGDINFITDKKALLDAKLIVAGSLENSKIYTVLMEGSMPPTGPLATADYAFIGQWIALLETEEETDTNTDQSDDDGDPHVTATPTPTPTPTPTAGETLFVNHCSPCHTPAERAGRSRPDIITARTTEMDMSSRADITSLTNAELDDIVTYLSTQ